MGATVSLGELRIGDHVVIVDEDDDMHGQKGTFLGNHAHAYGIKTLILLDDSQRHFYATPERVQRMS